MIEKVELYRFKRFKESSIDLLASGVSVLAGPNNAGKSSLLHALAVWSFCRNVVEFERGRWSLNEGANRQGVGIGDDEFFPINVPSLTHLWTNLKTQKVPGNPKEPDGYTLKIKAHWKRDGEAKHLEFGLALANDRLFIKCTSTNLSDVDRIPTIAYLPPFAGITDKESRFSKAEAAALIGQGLAGATIRNTLLDLYQDNLSKRSTLKGAATKISSKSLRELRSSDPWERLIKALEDTFSYGLRIQEFNSNYHRFVKVEGFKGELRNGRFSKFPSFVPRDLMVEGSGFLQWLSVFALAVSPDIDVLLLDEPDAHLHVSLQAMLFEQLEELTSSGKQVLIATHSIELLKKGDYSRTLWVKAGTATYLSSDAAKIGLLAGIGSEFFPRLSALTEKKRLLIVEGPFDEDILKKFSQRLGRAWNDNIVVWQWNGGHKERKQLFNQLKADIVELKAISLRDRDDESLLSTNADLLDQSHLGQGDLKCLKWPRRQLDCYLLVPAAISRAAGVPEEEVSDWLATEHAVVIPPNFAEHNVPDAVKDHRAKEILYEKNPSIQTKFGVTAREIADHMAADEIGEDIRQFFDHLDLLST